jgi:hypothetical protein
MDVGFEALSDHADGVANSFLRIDHEFMRQNVEHFAVCRKRDVASCIDGAAHIVALNVAGASAEAEATAAVDAANMAASYADHRGFDRDVGYALGFLNGAANRANCGVEIDDEAFAQTFGFGRAQREKSNLFAVYFRNQRARFRTAYVQSDDVTIFFCQAAAPTLEH